MICLHPHFYNKAGSSNGKGGLSIIIALFMRDTLLQPKIQTKYGYPDIFNMDQGSQLTSKALINRLSSHGIAISKDGKGRCMGNIFIERCWKSAKYEDIYLKV